MIACGIDPGLTHTSFAFVQAAAGGRVTAYGPALELLSHGKILTASPNLADWDLTALLDALRQLAPAIVGVEVARGSIRAEIAADPVLRNNITGGAVMAFIHASGFPVAAVAAGGLEMGWSWRSELGVKGKGATERDRFVRGIVKVRGIETPTGPKGGLDQDTADAIGIAAAVLDRAQRRPHLSAQSAITVPDRITQLVMDKQKEQRAIRKKNRALKKEFEVNHVSTRSQQRGTSARRDVSGLQRKIATD